MTKPIVHYDNTVDHYIKLGGYAFVKPLDHYSDLVSNNSYARTGTVIKYNKRTGIFETPNTVYHPSTPL